MDEGHWNLFISYTGQKVLCTVCSVMVDVHLFLYTFYTFIQTKLNDEDITPLFLDLDGKARLGSV